MRAGMVLWVDIASTFAPLRSRAQAQLALDLWDLGLYSRRAKGRQRARGLEREERPDPVELVPGRSWVCGSSIPPLMGVSPGRCPSAPGTTPTIKCRRPEITGRMSGPLRGEWHIQPRRQVVRLDVQWP
jgi:hypothetical protein